MYLTIDADIALFAVRRKLEKEIRVYYLLREYAKDSSGYINRKEAVKRLSEETLQSRPTTQRHIKCLVDMGFISVAGKGNIHINGILRVKELLSLNVEGFQIRRRTLGYKGVQFKGAASRQYKLASFKAALTSGLTHDKLQRNRKKFIKDLPAQERKSKAVIGTALANDLTVGAYAFSIKSADWAMGLGTVNNRKKVAESEKFEWYRWQELLGKTFRSEREAIECGKAHIESFNKGYLKRRGKYFLVCTGERIYQGSNYIELKHRNSKAKGEPLNVTISGKAVTLKVNKIKALRAPKAQKNLFIDDFRPFGYQVKGFSFDFPATEIPI